MVAIEFLPDILIDEIALEYDEKATQGTFYLIQEKLKGLSDKEKEQNIKLLQAHFGYPLKLLKKGDPLIDNNLWEKIASGQFVNPTIDDADYYIKKLDDSDLAVAITFDLMQSEDDHLMAQGTYHLIKEKLVDSPQSEWQAIINHLQTQFGLQLSFANISDLTIPDEKQRQLKNGKIIALDHDTDEHRYIGMIADSSYALIIGYFQQPFNLAQFLSVILAAFIVLLAIALYLWIRPLWRSVNELSHVADAFGQGHLETRSTIKSGAILGNLAIQFNHMAEQISKLVNTHRDLTNAVSHELRTPIARLRFALQMLEDNQNQTANKRYLQSFHTDVDELESLVDELLTFARYEAVPTIQTSTEHLILPWIKSVASDAQGYCGTIAIQLSTQQLKENQIAKFHPRYMARVIHNLLRNACRYSQQTININLNYDDNQIIIHVDDDGPGIAVTDRLRVFGVFSRLDESREKNNGGFGLGLAIALRIVQSHQGTIIITESPIGGARFTVSWPA